MLAFILLNFLLFLGAYFAGCVPISFSFPTSRLRTITVFGTGLLLGAVLAIIIPEGVETLYSGQSTSHLNVPNMHSVSGANKEELGANMEHNPELKDSMLGVGQPLPPFEAKADNFPKPPSLVLSSPEQDSHLHSELFSKHQLIGLSLLLGYLFMLLVDQMSDYLERCCSKRNLGCCFTCGSRCFKSISRSTSVTAGSDSTPVNGKQTSTATLGLVFHSFADGLALGAAFAVDQIQLKLVLFLAIIIHKIPAAFGLSCYLVHAGLSRDKIRLHLFFFAAASPLASIVTYTYLSWPSVDSVKSNTTEKAGIALLVSGGTFLYVAASHILPDIIHTVSTPTDATPRPPTQASQRSSDEYTTYALGSQDPLLISTDSAASVPVKSRHLSLPDLLTLVVGSLVPLLLSIGHAH